MSVLPAVPSAASASGGDGERGTPGAFSASTRIDNRYFPLSPETTLVYKGMHEGEPAVDYFEVTDETRVVNGVRCRVVHDRLYVDGRLVEDTYDWFAQDRAGNVWYFGERTREFDEAGNVVSTEGSWEAGVDGARQGIYMPRKPRVGAVYQQEVAAGAQDLFKVLSLDAKVTVPYGTFTNAMKTKEWTPLEPGVVGRKYYAPRVGTVLEADLPNGDYLELVRIRGDERASRGSGADR